jgi:hypothetical protein
MSWLSRQSRLACHRWTVRVTSKPLLRVWWLVGGLLVLALLISIWNYVDGSSEKDRPASAPPTAAAVVAPPKAPTKTQQSNPEPSAASNEPSTPESLDRSSDHRLRNLILPQVVAWEKQHVKVLRGLASVKAPEASVLFVSLPRADQELKRSIEQTLASSGVATGSLPETRRRLLGDLGVSGKHRVIQFSIHEADADKDVAVVNQTEGPNAITIDPVSGNVTLKADSTELFRLQRGEARQRFRHLFDVSE